MNRRHFLQFLKQAAVCFVAAFAAQLTMGLGGASVFDHSTHQVAPAFGVALGILFVGGFRYLPAIFVGTLLPYAYVYDDYLIALSLPVAVSVAGLLGLKVQRVYRLRVDMERIRDVLWIMCYGFGLPTLLGAVLKTVFLCNSEAGAGWELFQPLMVSNWLAAGLGSVAVAPFIMTWATRTSFELRGRQVFEVILWFATLILFASITLKNWPPTDELLYPMELAIFPIMVWAGIRFGLRGATAGVLVLALLAAWELAPLMGITGARMVSGGVPNVWVFVGIVAVTSVCLAAVMAELRDREARISENESRLRAFTGALPDVAFIFSINGRIDDIFAANSQIQRNHRIADANAVRTRNMAEVFDAGLCERFLAVMRSALASGSVRTLEYSMESSDGEEHWFEARVSSMGAPAPSGEKVVWVAYDITLRKRFEAAIKERDGILSATARGNNLLLTRRDVGAAVELAMREIGNALGIDRGYIFEVIGGSDEDFHRLYKRFEWRREREDSSLVNDAFFDDAPFEEFFPGWYERLRAGSSIQLLRSEASYEDAALLKQLNAQSLLAVPMWNDNGLYGFFAVDHCNQAHQWSESELSAVRVLASSFSGLILIKAREEALRVARDMADSANSAKGEFLAVMSHEIRTPMNAIIGYTDLLSQSDLSAEQIEHTSIIKRSGRALLELINSILDYSKIESRSLELDVNEFEIEQIVCEALESVLPRAKQKGLHLDFEIASSVDESYVGDMHRLRQVLMNLANNAVKFTDAGSVFMNVRCLEEESDADRAALCFEVADTGCGIPEEKFDRLFQPFSQVDASTSREYGGTGLGLAISKRLVEHMDGRISFESEVGVGSTFQFVVRLKRPLQQQKAFHSKLLRRKLTEAEELLVPEFARSHPLSILLCEDDQDNRWVLRELLETLGYQPMIVEDGQGIVALARQFRFDVILMDVRLPERSGIELTSMIRNGEMEHVDPNQYIIAVTAFAMNEDREKCLSAGMNDYLSKPLEISKMKNALIRAHAELGLTESRT